MRDAGETLRMVVDQYRALELESPMGRTLLNYTSLF
jgi:hypothetical protein